jgi:hypothetical protein
LAVQPVPRDKSVSCRPTGSNEGVSEGKKKRIKSDIQTTANGGENQQVESGEVFFRKCFISLF